VPIVSVLPHPELCPEGIQLQAEEGQSICNILLAGGVEIEHACEKVCACTTCHVIVKEGLNSLSPITDQEEDMLDKAWGLTALSRLSCQAKVANQAIIVELPRYTINHARE
jgi:2Fe-2S ferredoxin